MLLISETLEAIEKRIIKNSEIMKLMNLPTINKDDTEIIKNKKINQVIRKAITRTAQNPTDLGGRVKPIIIDDITYDKYGEIRMTISILQGMSLDSYVFGEPRIEINIYYDNSDPNKALKILDLLSNEFSGKELDVIWEENGVEYITPRELTCEGLITQVPNINNYERAGIRFSFYVSYYVPNY